MECLLRSSLCLATVFLLDCLPVSFGGETCVAGYSYSPHTRKYMHTYTYCSTSCCGNSYNRTCCKDDKWKAYLAGVAVVAAIMFIVLCCCCYYKKAAGSERRTIRTGARPLPANTDSRGQHPATLSPATACSHSTEVRSPHAHSASSVAVAYTDTCPAFPSSTSTVSPNDASPPPPYGAYSHLATDYGQPTPAQSAQPHAHSASSVAVAYTHTCPAFPSSTSTVSPNDASPPPPYGAYSHLATDYGQPTPAQSAQPHAHSASSVAVAYTHTCPAFPSSTSTVSPNDASPPPPYGAYSHLATDYGQPTPAQSAQPHAHSASSVAVAYTHTCPAFPSSTNTVSPNDTRPPPYDACSHPAIAYGQRTAAQSAQPPAHSASNVPVDHTCPAFSSSASIVSPNDTRPPPYDAVVLDA